MIAYFVKYQYFQFSGSPPINGNIDKILNLHFLRTGTDIFEDVFLDINLTQPCVLALK